MNEQAKDEERFIPEVTALRQRIAELEAVEAERHRAAVAPQQRTQELETLFTIASTLALPGNFGVQCRFVLEELARAVQAHRVILRMPDEEQRGLRVVSAAGGGMDTVPPIPIIPYGQSIGSLAFEQGETIVANDYRSYPGAAPRLVAYEVKSAAALPIKSGGRTLAVITLTSREPDHFGPDRMRFLTAIANGLGSLLENASLREEARQRATEMEVIGEVARIVTSTLTIDQVYEKFADEMKRLVHFDRININVIDPANGRFTIKYLSGQSVSGRQVGAVLPLAGTLTGQAATTGITVIRDDFAIGPPRPGDLEYLQVGLRSSITVPLLSKGGRIGSLTLRSRQPGAFGRREQNILERLAAQIAPAVENSLLYEELQARTEEKTVIDAVARIITSTLDIDQVYEHFAVQMKRLVEFERALLSVVDRDKKTYLIKNLVGSAAPGRPVGVVRPLAEGSCTHYVVTTNQTLVRPDLVTNPMFLDDADFVKAGLCSLIAVPLVSKDITIGCLILRGRSVGAYGSREQRILEGLAAQIAPAVENSLLYEELQASIKEKTVVDEVARIVTSTLAIDQVYEQFAGQMKRLLSFDRAALSVIGQDKKTYMVKNLYGPLYAGQPVGLIKPLAEGSCTHYAATTGQTINRGDLANKPMFPDDAGYVKAGLCSLLAVPLKSKETVIGCLMLRGRGVGAYGPREQRILEGLAAQIAPAVENSLLFQDMSRLVLALESIGDAVVFLDLKGRVQFVNRAAEEISGYTAAEMQGKPINLIAPTSPGSRVRSRETLRQAALGGWRGEVNAVRKDGEELTLNLSMAPVPDPEGGVIGIIGVAQDITERKRIEERIQETSRLISLGELAAGAAHEINNPLTVVAGFSQLLMAQDLPQPVRDDLEKIYTEAQRAARIVQNLLSFARKREPEKRYLDVTAVLDQALALKEHDFRVSKIQVTCHWSRDLPRTMVDEHQLIQAVLNILANAQQAMAETQGGGELVLRASHLRDRRATRLNGRIRISITDNGPGILPEHLPRIFDPFFTTKGVGEGTGLGLSIAYGIVQQHGGDLWAESRPGKGATFHLELPVLGRPEEAAPLAPNLAQTPAKTQRILVVDDEPAIRELLAKALATEGHEVDLAEDGEEAWDMVLSRNYGCILLDLKMPGMSGQQLYHRMAEYDQSLARRVIFMTGDTASPDTRDFISASGNPAVSKPFDVEELRQQILKSLEAPNGSR